MNIVKNIKVPTGNILVVDAERGKLECLSLGDYGKDHNIVCKYLGLGRKLDKVEHTKLLPLEEKWVITCSTQYGCLQKCKFCDVPNVKFGGNATFNDLVNQVKVGMSIHPEVTHSDRINVHWARMGEPTWNDDVLNATIYLAGMLKEKGYGFHPVVSTMVPKNNGNVFNFIREWMYIKNNILNGEAGLQLSINSTDDNEREIMFRDGAMKLDLISDFFKLFARVDGRKITLNFAVADYTIDAEKLAKLFDPTKFLVKLTPMHRTNSAIANGIETVGDATTYYPYEHYEKDLEAAGFDVLTFVASKEEDDSTITCGNAILGGSIPKGEFEEII